MTKKRLFIFAAVLALLGILVYLQFRTWRTFDWDTFGNVTGDLLHGRGLRHIAIAIGLIYLTYWLRAVRWKLFLKPVCNAHLRSLTPTQYIGFTGLAILGRPGELIRPYLIARKEGLTFSSQLAVWAVERIFDIGAFTVLMCLDVLLFGWRIPHPQALQLPHPEALQKAALALFALVVAMSAGAYMVRRNGPGIAAWLQRKLSRFSPKVASSVCHKMTAFGEGLNTIHDTSTLVQLTGVSLAIWFVIALAYRSVLHAYPAHTALHQMHVPQVLLLMASSMVGSMITLPAIGGGSQVAVISMLSSDLWFGVPHELAVSAGIMLWLITFVAVVPVGFALSHHEHMSLRRLTEETEQVEAEAAPM
jgi:glycosyltransferase 2 family protein